PVELEQRGAGIGFLKASYRYLVERAGIDLDAISISTSSIIYLGRNDEVVHQSHHPYRFSSWNTVYQRLMESFGRDRYHLNKGSSRVDEKDHSVSVTFEDTSSVDVDLVVAADGIRSTTRHQLLPDVVPQYAGYVAWRGTIAEKDLPSDIVARLGDAITYYVFANSHILMYPIPALDGSVDIGRRLFNFVWYRNYLDGGELEDLMTDVDGELRSVSVPPGVVAKHHVDEMRATAHARLPRSISEVVRRVEHPFLQVVYDIEVPRMRHGRICLIGDAAFAVRPHAAAGTAKAAEDAWSLYRHLQNSESLDAALTDWESDQLALGASLLSRTRSIGARSQTDNNWEPGDPELIFGLHTPGDAEPGS
ncbi:MAG: FAD-dependent monooxygenase, partial [Ilumatobacteraceae bacterium]